MEFNLHTESLSELPCQKGKDYDNQQTYNNHQLLLAGLIRQPHYSFALAIFS